MTGAKHNITADEVRLIVGDIDAERVQAILALGSTTAELEEAVAWAEGESDVMGEQERPSSPVIGAIYKLLMAELPEEER